MEKFNQYHQRNIRLIFEEKTGVDLNPAHKVRPRRTPKLLYLAAVLALMVMTMVSCQKRIFSPLSGDELALTGSYQGEGIVEVNVTNNSDMPLKLQKQTSLMSWVTAEEAPRLDGQVQFWGKTSIAPHSSEIIRLDLSKAYDMKELEAEVNPRYYLLLTNQNFLFGQDWICSVHFREEEPAEPSEPEESVHMSFCVEPEILERIEPELRFYFEDAYGDNAPAFNQQNFVYQDAVRERLMRFDGRLVRPADPWLKVEKLPDNAVLDGTFPAELQYILVGQNYHSIDGCGRIVGSQFGGGDSDYSLMLQALLPQYQGQTDGGVYLPLIYLFTFPRSQIESMGDFAFIYGQLVSFGELEDSKVYENEDYVVYELTDMFYTDLDAYLDYFLTTRNDIYFDESVRRRVHNIYDYYKDHDTLSKQFVYYKMDGGAHPMVPGPAE